MSVARRTAYTYSDGTTRSGRACSNCGTSYATCSGRVMAGKSPRACCGTCAHHGTHDERTEARGLTPPEQAVAPDAYIHRYASGHPPKLFEGKDIGHLSGTTCTPVWFSNVPLAAEVHEPMVLPKPPVAEPTGYMAVVQDDEGRTYVRWYPTSSHPWLLADTQTTTVMWSEITVSDESQVKYSGMEKGD